MRPAKVRFIGDDYRHEGHFTQGQVYDAYFLEYWNGLRNSLHVMDNAGNIQDFKPLEDFEVLEDPDNLLSQAEAVVRCVGPTLRSRGGGVIHGEEYIAIGRDVDGLYLVKDNSDNCFFYPPDLFEVVSDPEHILDHLSLYYSAESGDILNNPTYFAHYYSANHKPELEKDSVCGCFYCRKIFTPSEIKEWVMADNPIDRRGTAICPYCGVDAVLGESSGFPITRDFLSEMRKRWFFGGHIPDDEDEIETPKPEIGEVHYVTDDDPIE